MPPMHLTEKQMSTLTGEDVLATAKRAGWTITPTRAAEIAAAANSRIVAFDKARAGLTFDDDAAGFAAALLTTSQAEAAK